MPTQLTLLGEGMLASILVSLQIVAWVALGLRGADADDDALAVPLALLAGAAATSFVYALLTWSGHVTTAIVVVAAISAAALVTSGRAAAARLAAVVGELRELGRGHVLARVGLASVALGAWLLAISPPRDADVMRYHLAHIRQIVQDGRWTPIADYHYALPFGWSLSYLPFERAGLAVGANLLSLGVAIVAVAVLLRAGRRQAASTAALVLALGLVLVFQPMALKAATTAHVDAYAILVTATLVALLLRAAEGGPVSWGALGFVAFVGFQSRYQTAAIAIATSACALVLLTRREERLRPLLAYGGGAAAALVLASPFYVRNWRAFGDPVWPIASGTSTYADRVVSHYEFGLNGHRTLGTYRTGLHTLFTDTLLFPLPIVLVVALLALFLPPVRRRAPTLLPFLIVFCAVWAAAQPRLYSRFTLLVAPAIAIALAALLTLVLRRLPRAVGAAIVAVVLLPIVAFDCWYGRDTASLFATGDLAAYHRYTWYYPVLTWVDNHTPPDARGLVFLQSGLSYYLNRPYRRADPNLTGVVDWDSVHDAAGLRRVLRHGGYDFVLYDHAEWDVYPGGANVITAVAAAERARVLRPIKQFDVQLSLSRIHRTWTPAHVTVYAVAGARHPPTP